MKIRKWGEKVNANHFASHDTHFPFQQEIPNKNIFYSVFLGQLFFSCNSSKLSPVSRDIQSVFIYCNINFENSLNTKFSFLLLHYNLKTVRSKRKSMLHITWNQESKLNLQPSLHHLVNISRFVYHLTKKKDCQKKFFCTYLLNCVKFKHCISNVFEFESIFIIKKWNITKNLLFNHFLLPGTKFTFQ